LLILSVLITLAQGVCKSHQPVAEKIWICKEEKEMWKYKLLFAVAGMLVMGAPSKGTFTAGSWRVDAHHSDAQLITDATTDYGKTKMDVTLGFGRMNGRVELDNDNLAKSSFDIRLYPADSMTPDINEDGKFLSEWEASLSNHTLVCFHSKGAVRTPEGRLKTTGQLVLTRVDRNVEITSGEGYAGPMYGPPMVHRVSHEASFVFDIPADGKGEKDGGIALSGSTAMFREDYPQLVRAVVSTYWPPVVQDKSCQAPSGGGEDYRGSQCTGTLLMAPALPEAPHAANGEDVGAARNFNAVVGNHLNIVIHLHLTPKAAGEEVAAAN
jgi:polyisoprenoid-binding protein YceI